MPQRCVVKVIMIKCVIFDLDETLFDRRNTLQVFLADQYDAFRNDLGTVDKLAWIEVFLELDNRGKLSKHELYPKLLARFAGHAEASDQLIADYYRRSTVNAIEMDGMTALLDGLAARRIETAIITNGETELQTRTLRALGLWDRVDTILISQKEACRKPDREIFDRACARLRLDAASCLFVGDDPVSDVLGAHSAGMSTAWFNRDARTWPDDIASNPGPEIGRLGALLPILE